MKLLLKRRSGKVIAPSSHNEYYFRRHCQTVVFSVKKALLFLVCFALIGQLQAQTYRAKNAMRTYEVPVPRAAVRKFQRQFPSAQVDSCYVYGNEVETEREYMFYARNQGRIINASFDKRGRPVESKVETTVQELPQPLQQTLSSNAMKSKCVGKYYKEVTWLPKRKKTGNEKRKRTKVAYMVEFFTNYQGRELKVPMYFNESGYQANSGFR